ncbi:uncharacterized protein [Narcine bancroftii]|uniref:uncharacterized protein isoform X5 n=1 Tax=Narcine bancroftii TaxID=1343680 RepID=UPI003831524E
MMSSGVKQRSFMGKEVLREPSLADLNLYDHVLTQTCFHSHVSFLATCFRCQLVPCGFHLRFQVSQFGLHQDLRCSIKRTCWLYPSVGQELLYSRSKEDADLPPPPRTPFKSPTDWERQLTH